jgi:phosphate starvation-inducible PhoH-like protein
MPKKRRNGRKAELMELEKALCLNGFAQKEGPKRKTWSMHDLKTIKPLTPTQNDYFHAWYNNFNICAHGCAGTGKSFLAIYLALQDVISRRQNRIIIVRSAVSTRELGHLPGPLEEKLMAYEEPYANIFHELLGRPSSYQDMKDAGFVEFHSTSFLRGLTWDNTVVVLDEAENLTFHELDSVMTRLGENTRIIINGDTTQTDLDGSRKLGHEGLTKAKQIFCDMDSFECIEFNEHDIVRGELVKSWIMACNALVA